MTPEIRTAKVQREIAGRMIWRNDAEVAKLIARAIRSAENAALAKVWKHVQGYRGISGDTKAPLLNYIRLLNTRAPRRPR